jgi:fructokinase
VFGVILGTGCGGGVVVDRKVIRGANGIGGEWGHTPLPWPRADETPVRDWCGRWGCLEQWLSGTGFKRAFGMSAREADEKAQAGDAHARYVLDVYADRVARSLAVVIDILDPDVIVFGGGVSNVKSLYPSAGSSLRMCSPMCWTQSLCRISTETAPACVVQRGCSHRRKRPDPVPILRA